MGASEANELHDLAPPPTISTTTTMWFSVELEYRCASELRNHQLGASHCSALVFNNM